MATKPEPSTLDRLRNLARKVVKVPKEEVAELERKRQERKRAKSKTA